ncbi:FMN-binding glutamate synthase family protein [Shewanella baltica]|uniref:FMN-binding glutamate synthase family protein n=1 Tax=Shewanella baltica TaxID=62322 RepID=UPI00217D8861|nr:FMN-binding glutamate synthase family protein [Shewanella baltica]MCS6129474.1 FMN-binding glutamate synthase family protein [Shewanella baltica]MCS6141262.1 FMN-binding glutamate synthase family protein [Shewanella baltica]MCS6147546.1 FMN-binding glutamate synthase family protein [Shewanella baltica]MCS6172075.1 FMN-binding glutamate synthase family protein [Shewanella baltica]MCS6189300.1 FMN-binding glutamate synthase family protein [Shewanella baltica]
MKQAIRFTTIVLVIFVAIIGIILWPFAGLIMLVALLVLLGLYDLFQAKHSILRNFPVIGHMRYLLEMIGPELHQYFVESDTDGKPINKNHRNYIYERAKEQNQTRPFGTQLDVYDDNYKWMQHSIYPAKKMDTPPRVIIGGKDCQQPYSASLFNISAMSFGALSKNAIQALNLGAKAGDFFHDTGEGGISEYHLQGGDLVWEIGTGYFGCRTENGCFDVEKFKQKANWEQVKMIEIKLSQGAKPGHGGVLPAAKNNQEIAEIRGVQPHTDVLSPPGHSAFSDAEGLLQFVEQLRVLSNGKPVGFKLAIGSKQEFIEICEKMLETGIKPDFITVDGAEGGTGAAPIDFSNYVGMPWEDALIFAVDTLNTYKLKKDIKVITATKIFTAFDLFKALCIGADVCNSARGMMLALGCVQSLKCNTNECPTGVTTNNPTLVRGLVVAEKWKRVRNYHQHMLDDFLALLAASGCHSLDEMNRNLIYRKVDKQWHSYAEVVKTQRIL